MVKQISFLALLGMASLQCYAESNQAYPPEIGKFLSKHCTSCHGNEKHKGDINFEIDTDRSSIIKNYRLWESAAEQISINEMPPKKKAQPTKEEKTVFTTWLNGVLKEAAEKNANDPGRVVMRRLNRHELENTLNDLTGLKLDLSERLPSDGGGGEGFTNMGATLFTSPNHLEAYLDIFEEVSSKAAILPKTGLTFYDQALGERNHSSIKSEIVRSLREQYANIVSPLMPDKFEDLQHKEYLLAAWVFKNKDTFKLSSIADCAKAFEVHPIYLENWIKYLDSTTPKSRFLDYERVPFRNLPKASHGDLKNIPADVHKVIDQIVEDRRKWYKMQRPQQDSNAYRNYGKNLRINPKMSNFTLMVTDAGDGTKGDVVIWSDLKMKTKIKQKPWWREIPLKQFTQEVVADLEKLPQTEQRKKYINYLKKQIGKFGKGLSGKSIGPNDIVIKGNEKIVFPLNKHDGWFSGKATMWTNQPDIKVASVQQAVLSYAHWGEVPDLTPGFIVVYDDRGDVRRKIFEEIRPMREIFGDEKFRRMFKVQDNYFKTQKLPIVYYMSREQVMGLMSKTEMEQFEALHEDYNLYNKSDPSHIAWRVQKSPRHKDGSPNFAAYSPKQKKDYDGVVSWTGGYRKKIESGVLDQVLAFAEQAWRRPLDQQEKDELKNKYYAALKKGFNTESAARVLVQRVFLSPNFLFKVEKVKSDKEHPVSQIELATRLSYTLWASKPDPWLLNVAKNSKLNNSKVYGQHIARMLKSDKVSGLAKQFAGEWLEFRDFKEYTGLDKNAFPKVKSDIQALMEKECELFFEQLIRQDQSVMDIFVGDYTYLNEKLANYYGIKDVKGDHFRKVKVSQYQRGGLFGMGAMLVKTSYPLRTSPVLRGTYVLENILGHHLPAPPDDVPELEDSAHTSEKPMTVREMLQIHRNNENCASCHNKIDPLGFALEGFGPDAMLRQKDAGGQIDNNVTMKNNQSFKGLQGLKTYLGGEKEKLLKQVCRKFLGYSLGREVEIGDRAILEKMYQSLLSNQMRFSAMVKTLLESKVFKYRRGKETAS